MRLSRLVACIVIACALGCGSGEGGGGSGGGGSGGGGSGGGMGGAGGMSGTGGHGGSGGTGGSGGSGGSGGGGSGGADAGPACPGRVVAADADCTRPCELFVFLDGTSNQDHVGTDWCASACAVDADCPVGQFCDTNIGLGQAGHACVVSCNNNADCQAIGLPECDPTSTGDPRLSCF